jgi:hypothetical protein
VKALNQSLPSLLPVTASLRTWTTPVPPPTPHPGGVRLPVVKEPMGVEVGMGSATTNAMT